MIILKHKRLYKFLCLLEEIITGILLFACIIVMVSVPAEEGNYTLGFIGLKLFAMVLFWAIFKIEINDDDE